MKYIIRWNIDRMGDSTEIVEADSLDEARMMAYEAWRDDAEYHADYDAEEYSEEAWEMYQ